MMFLVANFKIFRHRLTYQFMDQVIMNRVGQCKSNSNHVISTIWILGYIHRTIESVRTQTVIINN
ncbi:hypothetical protein YC2023_020507 [Brassica napus]